MLVFTGGWPSQAHSSSSDEKLGSMSRNGDGRLSGTTSSSSSAVQVEGWRRPLLTTLATMLSEEEFRGARRQLDQGCSSLQAPKENVLSIGQLLIDDYSTFRPFRRIICPRSVSE